MNSIDLAERTLAVIGVDAVISRKVEKVSGAQKRDIRNFSRIVKSKVRAMINSPSPAKYTLPPDYMKLLDQLTSPIEPAQIQKMVSFLPPDVQTPFMALASNAYSKLQEEIPKNSIQTIAGVRLLTVDDPSYFKFHWHYSVIDNPLRIIDLISNGSLLRTQGEVVRELYPSISGAIEEAIDEEIPLARSKDDSFELPMETEIGLNVWRSLPVIKGEYQSLYFDANKEKDTDPQPSKSQLSNVAAASVSPAQVSLYPKST